MFLAKPSVWMNRKLHSAKAMQAPRSAMAGRRPNNSISTPQQIYAAAPKVYGPIRPLYFSVISSALLSKKQTSHSKNICPAVGVVFHLRMMVSRRMRATSSRTNTTTKPEKTLSLTTNHPHSMT